MRKLLELREERKGREVIYEVESVEEVDKFLETDEWIYELHDNIVQAYIDTMGRKEEGLNLLSEAEELFDLKILIKENKNDNEIWTNILSRKLLDGILCEFDIAQMNKYRAINDKYLREVGKLTEKYLENIKKIAENA